MDTIDSILTDTLVKRTPRVGPFLSLLLLFDSLQDGHLHLKTDPWCWSLRCPPWRELTLYHNTTVKCGAVRPGSFYFDG